MKLWQVTHDRKAGSFFHTLRAGFGHALMAQTLAPVPGLVAAGATDFLVRPPVREPNPEAEAVLRELVAGFRVAVGRETA